MASFQLHIFREFYNNVKKVVYDGSAITFIIQTKGDNDFWFWNVSRQAVFDYFNKNNLSVALFELSHDALSFYHASIFCDDCDNDTLGCSGGSFETIEDALKDLGVLK